ncbi:ERF family protein [Actinomadura alba]|uniref:ERF family protein n=1 Tax=Actinomadura alba TaxID=406431 RepID=A0ABR7LIP0_9ACTN|nr:ERF family protein [Actinomadura alba]MBC6464293.1 ERF family protein [Actinomadura alba]
MTEQQTNATPALNAALAKVQARLPKLERDRTVTVETKKGEPYSYSYATLAHLSEAVLPLLAENGLSFTSMPGAGSDGKMCVRYSLRHESGEALTGEFPISAEGGIQVLGGRITYARRYCLAAVVGIAADEDDESRLPGDAAPRTAQRSGRRGSPEQGAETAQRSRPARPAAGPPLPGEEGRSAEPPITQAQLKKLHTVFSAVEVPDRETRLQVASLIVGRDVGSSNELTKVEGSTLIDTLDRVAAGGPEPGARLWTLLGEIEKQREGESAVANPLHYTPDEIAEGSS